MIRSFLSIVLLTCAATALAQESTAATGPGNLRENMTEAEFKAAGLDKLSPAELAALEAWLQRKVGQQTAAAVAEAKEAGRKEVEREARGFFDFGSAEPIESTIAGSFNGFAKGRQYTLANGQVWEQAEPASLAGVRLENPRVRIAPSRFGNTWFMKIEGYNTAAPVRRIK